MLIDGIHVPLTVPFGRDGAVAVAKLEANVKRYSLGPVAGLVALAPGGEAAALDDAECVAVFEAVARGAREDKVLVAGVARESVRGALALIDAAHGAGFDVALVVAPQLSDAEVGVFVRSVADASALPLMLWSRDLSVGLVEEMSRHANVLGVYEEGLTRERLAAIQEATREVKREVVVTTVFTPATRRMQEAARQENDLVSAASLGSGAAVVVSPAKVAVKLRSKVVGFQVMAAGSCVGVVEMLRAGMSGAMPTLSACAPQATYEMFAAFKDGDEPLALEKAERVLEADKLVAELGVAGVKYGCDVNGYAGGVPRLPRLALTAMERDRVEQVIGELKN